MSTKTTAHSSVGPYADHPVINSQYNHINQPTAYTDVYGTHYTAAPPGVSHENNATSDDEDASGELTDGEIAGIVVGSVVGFILLSCLFYYCLFGNNRRGNDV